MRIAARLAIALAAALGCAAQAQSSVDSAALHAQNALMRDLFVHLHEYYELAPDERDRFTLDYCVEALRAEVSEVEFVYELDAERHVVAVDADGCAHALPPPDHVARNPLVISNQPRGELSVDVHVRPSVELGARVAVDDIYAAAGQASRAMRRRAGPFALALPAFTGAVFEWRGSAPDIADAVFADGARMALEVDYDRAWFRPSQDRRLREAEYLEFSEPPAFVSLTP